MSTSQAVPSASDRTANAWEAACAELAARAVDVDRRGRYPKENIELLADAGLLGLAVPRALGGMGLGPIDDALGYLQAIEDLAAACSSTSQLLMVHCSAQYTVSLLGTAEQARRFAAESVHDRRVFAYLGSEATQRRTALGLPTGWNTTLTRDGAGWRLDGDKFFATGAPGADYLMVLAADVEGRVVIPVVRSDAEGVTITDDWDSMGQRATASGRVALRGVRVEDDDVIGQPGAFADQPLIAPWWQLSFAAIYLGIARGALRYGIDYLLHEAPTPIGLPSASHDPQIQTRLADLSVAIERSSALVRRAGEALAAFRPGDSMPAAMAAVNAAKIATTETSLAAGSQLFDLCGARATTAARDADRFWRNARTLTLHDPVAKRKLSLGSYLLGVGGSDLEARTTYRHPDSEAPKGTRT